MGLLQQFLGVLMCFVPIWILFTIHECEPCDGMEEAGTASIKRIRPSMMTEQDRQSG